MIADLESGDDENSVAVNEIDEDVSEGGDEVEEEEDASLSSEIEGCIHDPNEGRLRRPPIWMRDYESGEGLSEEENKTNLTLSAYADPVYFEEVVKTSKWRIAMYVKIKAIEKNETWMLTDLPTGAKKI